MDQNQPETGNLLNSRVSSSSYTASISDSDISITDNAGINVIKHHVIELSNLNQTEETLLNLRLFEMESNRIRHDDSHNDFLTFLVNRNNEKFPKEKFFKELFGYSEKDYKIQPKLFQKIFDIFDDNLRSEYHEICLEAIYLHFHELIDFKFENDDIKKLIERALKIKNQEYGMEVLKILFVFLSSSNNQIYKDLKQSTLAKIKRNIFSSSSDPCRSTCNSSYKEMKRVCNHDFFKLLFLLKENYVQKFKVEYKKFVKSHKQSFGEYWIYEIKRNGQLLHLMADLQNLIDSKEYLLLKTKESDLKASIMTSFRGVAEFQAVFKRPLKNEDQKLLVNIDQFRH